MAIEQGIVIKMGSQTAGTAWVKTVRSSACESCASRDSCNPGGKDDEQEVEALNTVGAKVGDRIQLMVGTGAVLKAIFLLYLFPILCMLAGGALGDWIAPRLGLHHSVSSAIMALLLFALALVFVRMSGRRMARKEAYRPKIVRILRNGNGGHPEDESAVCPTQSVDFAQNRP